MKPQETKPHPGPFRIPQVDSEAAGILVAAGFVLMGIVAIPIAKWFVMGGVVLGASVALLLRYVRKRRPRRPLSLGNLR